MTTKLTVDPDAIIDIIFNIIDLADMYGDIENVTIVECQDYRTHIKHRIREALEGSVPANDEEAPRENNPAKSSRAKLSNHNADVLEKLQAENKQLREALAQTNANKQLVLDILVKCNELLAEELTPEQIFAGISLSTTPDRIVKLLSELNTERELRQKYEAISWKVLDSQITKSER